MRCAVSAILRASNAQVKSIADRNLHLRLEERGGLAEFRAPWELTPDSNPFRWQLPICPEIVSPRSVPCMARLVSGWSSEAAQLMCAKIIKAGGQPVGVPFVTR